MLDIVAGYHRMQFQRNHMIKNQENGKKLCFRSDLGSLRPNLGRQVYFSKIWLRQTLDIMVSYHHLQYQKKLMIQSLEKLVTDGRTDGRTDRNTDEGDLIRQ